MEYRSKVDWGSVLGLLVGVGLTVSWLTDLPEDFLVAVPALIIIVIFVFR